MFEVSCAGCQASFEYNPDDYIHLCPFCSAGFVIDSEEGTKDLIGDHYIIQSQVQQENINDIFDEWIKARYHKPDNIKNEFKILGSYGVMIPYWIISLEAHTFWSGHSTKEKTYSGQSPELAHKFVKEDGRFSRRYRWALLARRSPKEHWGMERLHHPQEGVLVDWDGFPFDESMGKPDEGSKSIYEAKTPFKFEIANSITISGIQIKENAAIARAKDQINEYHRRIAKSKIGTLYEHRTELEIVGIHVVHVPFWEIRYAFIPKGMFRFFTTARERHLLLQGYTKSILEAELPLSSSDKVFTNAIICGLLGFVSLTLSIFFNSLFYLFFVLFLIVTGLSTWKIINKEKADPELRKGFENNEPAK